MKNNRENQAKFIEKPRDSYCVLIAKIINTTILIMELRIFVRRKKRPTLFSHLPLYMLETLNLHRQLIMKRTETDQNKLINIDDLELVYHS